MAARRKTNSKAGAKTLTDVARKIGAKLGEVKSRSEKIARGLKAAAEASSIAYTGTGRSNKRTVRPTRKKSPATR